MTNWPTGCGREETMKLTENYAFFFSKDDALSNWHIASFGYKGLEFNCVEQFMMYSKAVLFGDLKTAEKILLSPAPKEQKRLGRSVANFDQSVWDSKALNIVTVACREKFSQNPHLLKELERTGNRVIAEASPYDIIWGIGLGKDDPRIEDEAQWRGTNLLGEALMTVRMHLLNMEAHRNFRPVQRNRPRIG